MMGMPRPGKVLLWVMGVLLSIWIMFAVGINWAHLDPRAFHLFTGNTPGDSPRRGLAPLHGRAHAPALRAGCGAAHPLCPSRALLSRRDAGDQVGLAPDDPISGSSTLFGFAAQMAFDALLPRAVGAGMWFGSMGAVEAVAVAWALSNRNQTVRLMFVLPVTGTGLLIAVIGFSVLYLIVGQIPHEGMVTPFAGMLAGYLFGSGTPRRYAARFSSCGTCGSRSAPPSTGRLSRGCESSKAAMRPTRAASRPATSDFSTRLFAAKPPRPPRSGVGDSLEKR